MTNQRLAIRTCDGPALKRLVAASLGWLEQNYQMVDQLNVFPVPDGDTGTNMLLTLRSAYGEIAENDSPDVSVIADKLAYGAIMGSRGNSGTILSQLFRGFAQVVSGRHEFDAALLAAGAREAVKMAYKAVQTPVEGTILTVAREAAEEIGAAAKQTDDLKAILERAVDSARRAVAHTPDLLPILKKAGVVDSGGQGLALILEGMLRYLNGETLAAQSGYEPMPLKDILRAPDERGYGYDVQYILHGKNLDLEAVRAAIGSMGDSMVVVGDSSAIKVHVHVHDPGIPISYGVSLGVISDVVVENMQAQSEDYIAMRAGHPEAPAGSVAERHEATPEVKPGDIGVVAVAPGEGLRRVLRDLGVSIVVSGGQTMNPSTEELLKAVQSLPTDKVIVLPNNKNIILAAEQAAQLASQPNARRVVVVPTRTVPQGISAMLSFNAAGDFESVTAAMTEATGHVVTGEVTTATRSVELDGVNVEAGQMIGLVDGKLAVSGHDLLTVVRDLLKQMHVDEREIVTLYYGDHVSEGEANTLVKDLRSAYPGLEFDVIQGDQPHYHYIVSAE
jgi:DAK2 domain fusion protein YloV